jgi:SpoVK/Ycf46/Vps4 family AAA+-type ATPase
MDMTKKLENHIRANYFCLCITTFEEARSIQAVTLVAQKMEKTIYTFSFSEGLRQGTDEITNNQSEWGNHLEAMKELPDESVILILDPPTKDEHNKVERRLLRDLMFTAPKKGSVVILIAPFFKPWAEIEKFVTIIEFSLPNKRDLEEIVQKSFDSLKEGADKKRIEKLKKSMTPELVKALSGLSSSEAENALFLAWAETEIFDTQVIFREKMMAVKKTDLLEIVEANPLGLDGIGGLENMKKWLLNRKKAYTLGAEKYRLPTSKGVLIMGQPGSGKSHTAKSIGTCFGIPTLHLDIGKLFGGIVGETEQRTRDTMNLAEALSPCVLWVDEVEKALDNSGRDGSGGVEKRLLGKMLQWMQDKKAPVFLVMTSNEVWKLPAAFLRKGRFDALFSVDLPNKTERKEIMAVSIKDLSRDPKDYDLDKIASASDGFVGAELRSIFEEVLFDVFDPEDLSKEPTTEDVLRILTDTIPLSKTSSEDVAEIKKWAKGRAIPASKPETVTRPAETAGRKITARRE